MQHGEVFELHIPHIKINVVASINLTFTKSANQKFFYYA
jgi:hypothetical protein